MPRAVEDLHRAKALKELEHNHRHAGSKPSHKVVPLGCPQCRKSGGSALFVTL